MSLKNIFKNHSVPLLIHTIYCAILTVVYYREGVFALTTQNIQILKRDGRAQAYDPEKIIRAMERAFASVNQHPTKEELSSLCLLVEEQIKNNSPVTVENIQDTVERTLMEKGHYEVSKSYILYRNERTQKRVARSSITNMLPSYATLDKILNGIQNDFPQDDYSLSILHRKLLSFAKTAMTDKEKLDLLLHAAAELTSTEAPKWEMIAARLLYYQFSVALAQEIENRGIRDFYSKLKYLTDEGLYGSYILENYTREDIETAYGFIDESRNELFTYSGLELLITRYLIIDHQGTVLESPQEMFLGIALHLAMKEEENRLGWVQRFYDMLSTLKVTMATPTLANSRKPFHQLSSCFIDTVPDSLTGIYRSIDNFAQVSKYGGGMGMYFGKVRAQGSAIRGFKGASGGVIRWIKLANTTAVAVDQLGVRQGAVAVYLDAWHRDLPEFLGLRTNSGDDRMKAHDVFPAVCYPNLFWKTAQENIEADWYLMCPHEISAIKGYNLEDSWGDEWEEKYRDCVNDVRIKKRVIPIKDLVRLIIKSSVETGTPFAFNRDLVNEANPNAHKGIIYSSNLCTEIAQNMSAIESVDQHTEIIDGEEVVVTTTKPGDFVVCNLASLSLGNIDVQDENELETLTQSTVRALDNVIDLNFFPVPYAKINNMAYRPIGLGVSGYHHMLAKNKIAWESDEHLEFVDKVFERINYAAIAASCETAKQKGSYAHFEGSDWQTGAYFDKRSYNSEKWAALRSQVAKYGVRNAWLLAVAPTSSTSIIAGTTAGVDPVMNRFFLEEKKSGLMPRVAPDLSPETFWYYKNAHQIDQSWSVRAAGVRSRHIDQAQSMNLYITNDFTFRQVLSLYIQAYQEKVKTIYYIRSQSLEVEECESCSS